VSACVRVRTLIAASAHLVIWRGGASVAAPAPPPSHQCQHVAARGCGAHLRPPRARPPPERVPASPASSPQHQRTIVVACCCVWLLGWLAQGLRRSAPDHKQQCDCHTSHECAFVPSYPWQSRHCDLLTPTRAVVIGGSDVGRQQQQSQGAAAPAGGCGRSGRREGRRGAS
jgi:hypothetical protein